MTSRFPCSDCNALRPCQVIVDPVIDRPEHFPGDLHPSDSRWKAVGPSQPPIGTSLGVLDCPKLLDAFSTTEMTEEDLETLGVSKEGLRVDHYIKVRTTTPYLKSHHFGK